MALSPEFSAEEIRSWVLDLNMSKEITNFARDFADGVLLAEIVARFLPRYVSLNTFAHVSSIALKKYNWESIQKNVLRYFSIQLSVHQINQLVNAEDGAIERLIFLVRQRIFEALENKRFRPTGSASAQLSRRTSREGSLLNLSTGTAAGNSVAAAQSGTITSRLPILRSSQQQNPELLNSRPIVQQNGALLALNDVTKDQLIKKLYEKIRSQENQLAQKDDQIEMLTKKVDSLLEIACSTKVSKMNYGAGLRRNPPPSRCPTLVQQDNKSDDSLNSLTNGE